MVNRAGNIVEPNITTVAAAMNEKLNDMIASHFTTDVYDGASDLAWPLSYMAYFSVYKAVQMYDCTYVQEQLDFLSWVYTNEAYASYQFRLLS